MQTFCISKGAQHLEKKIHTLGVWHISNLELSTGSAWSTQKENKEKSVLLGCMVNSLSSANKNYTDKLFYRHCIKFDYDVYMYADQFDWLD